MMCTQRFEELVVDGHLMLEAKKVEFSLYLLKCM